MKFPDPLIRGTLERRYKRFLADVRLENGDTVVAHCANSGSLLTAKEPGSEVWISPARNPDRKLKYTWEMIRVGRSLVGINTAHPNGLVEGAIKSGKIVELAGADNLRREVKYGKNSRIDILLETAGKLTYVEVKNVTFSRQKGLAEFPDSVTARGAKHLVELSDMVAEGHRAVMVYLVQRQDCKSLSVAGDIDPVYAEALIKAKASGVEVLCYSCKLTRHQITVDKALPINI
jgi:sugar fermentation stimulation protein A